MQHHGFKNLTQVAKAVGYTSAEKLSRLDRDKTTNPSFQIIADLSNLFVDINTAWLITGSGQMLIEDMQAEMAYITEGEEELPRKNLRVEVSEKPASYDKETNIRLDIKLKGNKVVSINQIEVSESDASPEKNKEAIKELTKLVTSNMPSSKK